MRWFNYIGVAMQACGVVLGMFLLARLHETTTGRNIALFQWARATRRLANRLVRWIRRQPPQVVTGEGRGDLDGVTGRARGTVTRGPMPPGLATEDQITWLEAYVRQVEASHNNLHTEVGQLGLALDTEIRNAREYALRAIDDAVSDSRAEFRKLVGQDVGWEIASLLLILTGLVVTVI